MSDADDELLLRLHRESEEQTERTRALLREMGRPDLVEELDARLRDIRTGVDGARSTWHSISAKQRFVLTLMDRGFYLSRSMRAKTTFDAYKTGERVLIDACRLPTLRNMSSRELIHVAGALDPEAKFVITERGRFVRKWGPVTE